MAQMSHQLKRGTVSSSLKREPYCTVGYRCQPLLSGADWQRVQMARKSSQISKWSLQGWRFLSPPAPTLTNEMGCGPVAHTGLHIPNRGMQRAEGFIDAKMIKHLRTTDALGNAS